MDEFLNKLFAAFGLGVNAPDGDKLNALRWLISAALNLDLSGEINDEAMFEAVKAEWANRAIDLAVVGGKLLPEEKQPIAKLAPKWNLAVFLAFIGHRKPISPVMRRLAGSAGSKTVEIDDVQAAINRQLGVSESLF